MSQRKAERDIKIANDGSNRYRGCLTEWVTDLKRGNGENHGDFEEVPEVFVVDWVLLYGLFLFVSGLSDGGFLDLGGEGIFYFYKLSFFNSDKRLFFVVGTSEVAHL